MKIKSFAILFLLVMVGIGICNELHDNLMLNGNVLKIENGKVKIYVKALSCKGEREFIIDNKILSFIKEGDNIRFIINSSRCENNKLPKIIEVFKR